MKPYDPVCWEVESGPYKESFGVYATAQAQVFELRKGGYPVTITPIHDDQPIPYATTPAGRTHLERKS